MRFKTWAWGLSVASMALLTACGGGGGDGGNADVRLLNASIGYSALDMAVGTDQKVVNSAVAYAKAGSYASVSTSDSGTYIQNSTVGSTLSSTTPTLSSGTKYTLIAYGTTSAVRTTLLQDNQDKPDAGKSKFLILNLAPDAGALDVYETVTTSTNLDDAATVASGIATGGGSGYASLKSGTFRFVVTAAGDKTDVRLTIPSLTLPDAGVSTLILTGSNGGVLVNGMQVIQEGDVTNYANTSARVRLVAGLPSGNLITGSVGSVPLLTSAGTPAIGSYTQVTAGSQAVALTVNGNPVSTGAAALTAGNDYTMLVYGTAASPSVSLLSDDNKLPNSTVNAKIRVINGLSNTTGGVDLRVNYAAYGSNVVPGSASTATQTPAVTNAQVSVTASQTAASLFSKSDVTLTANNNYSVFVLGDINNSPAVTLLRDR
ncbi:DUF4397 domain-containing protein [Roseateles terrae]|uniref:DUF4397 domain-containing protein n=1 Tax=Roseateles terrae TaxID=431060 RepID=A0ABR6GUS4_9BURK|nr:DUF4397 domain-containing protein [Roseateles terrae]MBB3194984.1 hypothetical protein [Roseateles terrae]